MAKKLTSEQQAFFNRILVIMAIAAISMAVYVLYAYQHNGTIGFPLDDGWIHQTYARSVGNGEGWVYQRGLGSGGSTSPVYTMILAVIYWLYLPPIWGTFVLGWISFVIAGALAEEWLRRTPLAQYSPRFPVAAVVFLLEWHFVWASLSGMETLVFMVFILGTFLLLTSQHPRWFWIGCWVGLSAWVRPDGITLLGPVIFFLIFSSSGKKRLLMSTRNVLFGFVVLFLPYLIFNRLVAGHWMPNTFYAKQAEYGVMQQIAFIARLGKLFFLPFIGVGALVLPGLIGCMFGIVKRRCWLTLAALLWGAGYIFMYVLRLPVTYQHGRYVMPAMPVFILLGAAGSLVMIRQLRSGKFWERIVGTAWHLSIVLLLGVFWIKGMAAYQVDTAIIQEEMVNPSIWISKNTPPDALVAAHDIGALGYFGDREILDLAGLISPEVIPMIRDESRLADYLEERSVHYLMTFPDWYSDLPQLGTVVYESGGQTAREMGASNMMIYQLNFDE